MLGLPELPHLTFDVAARFGWPTGSWRPLESYCGGRAMAWIDDNFDQSCYEWAERRAEPTLLVPTDPTSGSRRATPRR